MSTINDRAARVFFALCLGFVGVVAMLTWWQVFEAEHLRNRSSNNQTAYYEQRVKRGLVRTSDGVVLAKNRSRASNNGDRLYSRAYPGGGFAAHVVGYNTVGRSRTGVERSQNDHLTGSTRSLGSIFGKLDGSDVVVGDNVRLTLNAKAQRVAQQALGSRRGAVVVIEPSSGRILVLASSPTFDLNAVQERFETVTGAPGSPLINRATQARYAPGSTFKLVTAAAALESGEYTEDETFPGGCRVKVAFETIENFGGSCIGQHSFTEALTRSVNVTFAKLGEDVGATALIEQMQAFNFYEKPLVDDLPANEQAASGLFTTKGKPLEEADGIDVARLAIGQERLQVTPLQMALVAATIANGGQGMRPFLVEEVRSATGRVRQRAEEQPFDRRAMSVTNANALAEMMRSVVREGTGTQAALQGIDVAGKTGTAEVGDRNQVWFVGFAPADDPKVAVAVTLEDLPQGQTGGVVAAPIAADVMEAVLR